MVTNGKKTIRGNTLTINGNNATYKTKDGYLLHGTLDKRFSDGTPLFFYEAIVQMAGNRDVGHMLLNAFMNWWTGGMSQRYVDFKPRRIGFFHNPTKRRDDTMARKKKWGKIGAPKSAKRRAWLKRIRKK